MLNKIVTSGLTPLYSGLNKQLSKQGLSTTHIRMARIATGLLAILLFGLQYMGLAVIVFLLHKIVAGLSTSPDNQEQRAGHYLVGATALLAVTWTASGYGLPVAFLFWALLANIITEAGRPASTLRLADSGELSLICIFLALAPDYLPAIAIMGGVLFTISAAWNSLSALRAIMGKI